MRLTEEERITMVNGDLREIVKDERLAYEPEYEVGVDTISVGWSTTGMHMFLDHPEFRIIKTINLNKEYEIWFTELQLEQLLRMIGRVKELRDKNKEHIGHGS